MSRGKMDNATGSTGTRKVAKAPALAADYRGPTHTRRLQLDADKSSANRSARSMRRNLARLERKGQL